MSQAGGSETDSHQSTVIADLDAHISITQAQIAHSKKAGETPFIGDRAEVYRANKAARKEIRELTDRLSLLYEIRRKAKPSERPPPNCPVRKSAPYPEVNITTRQKRAQMDPEDVIASTVSRVLLIAEQTVISLKKWIEDTDKDPELNLLKQAIIDNDKHQIPAAFNLYENDLSVSAGLILVDGKKDPEDPKRVGDAGGPHRPRQPA